MIEIPPFHEIAYTAGLLEADPAHARVAALLRRLARIEVEGLPPQPLPCAEDLRHAADTLLLKKEEGKPIIDRVYRWIRSGLPV
jgi:hypothetical protein